MQAIVDWGRYVIRYDNRDTGQTTCFDFAQDPCTLERAGHEMPDMYLGEMIDAMMEVGARAA